MRRKIKQCQTEVPKIVRFLMFRSCSLVALLLVPLCHCTIIAVVTHLDPPLKPTAPLHLIVMVPSLRVKVTREVSLFMWAYKKKKQKMEIHCMKPPFRVRSPGFLAKLHGQSGLQEEAWPVECGEPDFSLCSKGAWHGVWNSMVLVWLLFNRDLSGVATCCTGPKCSILHHYCFSLRCPVSHERCRIAPPWRSRSSGRTTRSSKA